MIRSDLVLKLELWYNSSMTRYRDPEKNREAVKAHYYKNKEYYREKNKKKRQQIIDWLIQEKNVPCIDCGVQYPHYVMEFDHIEPKSTICSIWSMTTWKSVKAERAKCEIVCANCHSARTHFRRQE